MVFGVTVCNMLSNHKNQINFREMKLLFEFYFKLITAAPLLLME